MIVGSPPQDCALVRGTAPPRFFNASGSSVYVTNPSRAPGFELFVNYANGLTARATSLSIGQTKRPTISRSDRIEVMEQEIRVCQNCKTQFTIEPEDFTFYEKIKVPPPTWCPQCRLVRRLYFRNERTLYPRNCDLCHKRTIAHYAPESDFVVYCRDCWWSDKWDPMLYGRDYDFKKPFFEQYAELKKTVPILPLQEYGNNLNAAYSSYLKDAHNTYLSFSIVESEEIYYSRTVSGSRQVYDSYSVNKGELVYENVGCSRVFQSEYLLDCSDCIQCSFLFDCRNCQRCFMSSNLRNKQYVFRNQQLAKGEYEQKIKEVNLASHAASESLKAEFQKMKRGAIHKYAYLEKTTNATGDDIENAKNSKMVFEGFDLEDVKYTCRVFRSKDTYDAFGFAGGELIYEGINVGSPSQNAKFIMNTNPQGNNIAYCENQTSGSNLFGCIGIRNKQYCILNKQYSKEEYEALLPKIIAHMNEMPYVDRRGRAWKYGEFFPLDFCPYAYNESLTQQYFPLTKNEAVAKGFRWRDTDARDYAVTRKNIDIPDLIGEASDKILEDIIECEHKEKCLHQCTAAFKIIPNELAFYRARGIPLPHLCPNCRHYERFAMRNPLELWHRQCMCAKEKHEHTARCPVEFETPYAPDQPEMVYCERCYQTEVA